MYDAKEVHIVVTIHIVLLCKCVCLRPCMVALLPFTKDNWAEANGISGSQNNE